MPKRQSVSSAGSLAAAGAGRARAIVASGPSSRSQLGSGGLERSLRAASAIAHGFLTLSLLPELNAQAFKVSDTRMGVNYGLNKVRFTSPVPVNSRVRGRFKLVAYEPIQGGAQVTTEVTIEREGSEKPVCVAEALARRYT